MKNKEIKYQIITIVLFLVAIGVAIIARRSAQVFPGPDSFNTPEAGFQVLMGGIFSICIQTSLFLAIMRMYILHKTRPGG